MLPYMVIALVFAVQRRDDNMSHRCIGHTFVQKEFRLFLHIEVIADWLKA